MSLKPHQDHYKNIVQVKKYNEQCYKVVLVKNLVVGERGEVDNNAENRGTVHDGKLENSISRAKQKIIEYALCNDWDWFITITIDPQKYRRDDLAKIYKDISRYIRNYRQLNNADVKYLIIPELHKDGKNWHFHGLIRGYLPQHLRDHSKKSLRAAGNMEAPQILERFGFNTFSRIKNAQACSFYISKYITKDLSNAVKDMNAKMYYCSRGLKTAETVKEGRLIGSLPFQFAYEGKFAAVQFIDNYEFVEKNVSEHMEIL